MPSAVVKLIFDVRTRDKLGQVLDTGPAVCVAPASVMPEKVLGMDCG